MFNLKSDLKIYTCDKYLIAQKVLKAAVSDGESYRFEVIARIGQRPKSQRNNYGGDRPIMRFNPESVNADQFREWLEMAGISLNSLEDLNNFHQWAKNNPDKTWNDFYTGVKANLSLNRKTIDDSLGKIRPDSLMNELALSPNSHIARLIGKASEGYRRRRKAKETRQNQLIRLWVLFGTEVAISAASKDLESILNGIVLHDFGITHCESMAQVIEFVGNNIHHAKSEQELALEIQKLDKMIVGFGGKVPNRSRPRSPFFRQVYDFLSTIAAA